MSYLCKNLQQNSLAKLEFTIFAHKLTKAMDSQSFTDSLFSYNRVKTSKIQVGEITIGGDSPIRIQSMTTTDTNNTQESVKQAIRIIEAGADVVRLTTQGRAEAENIRNIHDMLRSQGYLTPLVADVHFNPNAALIAAGNVEKVRINPGNFTGERKLFDTSADNKTDEEWQATIVSHLKPLVDVCLQNDTALRIGVNHGSLSDRIMAKYGDTPEGMVASCTEYIKALESLNFRRIVISIKSSNTRVMVQTVRQLVATMRRNGTVYPLHLGVTEAGSDTEGRIKSAVGIGALLTDGIGDTIRVSLTEAPEAEVPVAIQLSEYIQSKKAHAPIVATDTTSYSPFEYVKRQSHSVGSIGGTNKPVTTAELLSYPRISQAQISDATQPSLVFLAYSDLTPTILSALQNNSNVAVVGVPTTTNPTAELRAMVLYLNQHGISSPFIAQLTYTDAQAETFQLKAAADAGLLFIDGLIDGLTLVNQYTTPQLINETELQIMQATNVRFERAEFISCPACGRTLYNIQLATQKIKQTFGHLKGLKIAVMGCIVNGIGEMADADYGYVGAGQGKISLYKGKQQLKRALPEAEAIAELIEIIKSDGLWVEKIKE